MCDLDLGGLSHLGMQCLLDTNIQRLNLLNYYVPEYQFNNGSITMVIMKKGRKKNTTNYCRKNPNKKYFTTLQFGGVKHEIRNNLQKNKKQKQKIVLAATVH